MNQASIIGTIFLLAINTAYAQRVDPAQGTNIQTPAANNSVQSTGITAPQNGVNNAPAGMLPATGYGATTAGLGVRTKGYGQSTSGLSAPRPCNSYPPDPLRRDC